VHQREAIETTSFKRVHSRPNRRQHRIESCTKYQKAYPIVTNVDQCKTKTLCSCLITITKISSTKFVQVLLKYNISPNGSKEWVNSTFKPLPKYCHLKRILYGTINEKTQKQGRVKRFY